MIPSSSFRPIYFLFLIHFLLLLLVSVAESRKFGKKGSISALFVFGDSTVDSGNNNFIETISRSNFPPYGRDFPDHISTGRFSNGKLVTDFLASYMGIKDYIPPYLDPTLSLDDLKTGVCFASAGTGFDPLTAQINVVIPIEKQLKYFKEYKGKIEAQIGKEKSKSLISNAVYLISAGTNDLMVNYYGPTQIRRNAYNISTYQDFMLQLGLQLVQPYSIIKSWSKDWLYNLVGSLGIRNIHIYEGLLEMGARKIAFVGLPPIGCVPAVITLNSDNALTHRACIQRLCAVARDYNRLLQIRLAATQKQNPGSTLSYVDIYTPVDEMIRKPQKFGFEKVNVGCCGSGILEFSVLCNPFSPVCSDDSKYLFWDSIHPTEAAYYSVFQGLRPLVDRLNHN